MGNPELRLFEVLASHRKENFEIKSILGCLSLKILKHTIDLDSTLDSVLRKIEYSSVVNIYSIIMVFF